MNKVLFLILTLVTCMCYTFVRSETLWYYNVASNSFPDFVKANGKVSGQSLILNNSTDSALLLLSNRTANDSHYRFLVRFSCPDAKKNRHSSAPCGLVFGYKSPENYYVLELSSYNTSPFDDMTDERLVKLALFKVGNHKKTAIKEMALSSGFNLYGGLNTLCIDMLQNTVNVSGGDKDLNQLFMVDTPAVSQCDSMGVIVEPGGTMQVERTLLSYEHKETVVSQTQWTKELLDAHFAKSKNPFEGYWDYLDRDMDDGIARIGGKYRIALVENEDGYDVIYVSGAQVRKGEWREGMLKGRLVKTIFTDNYKAMWIDSTFRPIDDDVNGFFESGVILDMSFPVYKSKVRFSKVL